MKQQQYARYEKGLTVPSIDVLAEICRVHACSADRLLGLDGNPPIPSIDASNGGAVAIGHGAKSSVRVVRADRNAVDCRKCPYKKAVDALQRQGFTIPGVS